jgi:hypothetical protein
MESLQDENDRIASVLEAIKSFVHDTRETTRDILRTASDGPDIRFDPNVRKVREAYNETLAKLRIIEGVTGTLHEIMQKDLNHLNQRLSVVSYCPNEVVEMIIIYSYNDGLDDGGHYWDPTTLLLTLSHVRLRL